MLVDLVRLRPFEPKDAVQLYQFRNDAAMAETLVGFSTGYSMQDLADWIEFHRKKSNEVLYAIADKDSDLCIGHVGLYNIDHRIQKGEFAIIIGDPAWHGAKLGPKISHAVFRLAFNELNLLKIDIKIIESNEKSIHVHEKLGFKRDGRMRQDQFRGGRFHDVILLSLLKDEWRPPE